MDGHTRPEPPPEAVLIKKALKRNRISGREAARRAGISDARWRQIVSGYQTVSGSHIPVRAPDETLARMAHVAGVTADELGQAGREAAAEALEELAGPPAPAGATDAYASDPHLAAITALLESLSPEARNEVLRRVGHMSPVRGAQEQDEQRRHIG
ncbi:helix-turn-helix domain-containing protein [Streptomyces milbemycinicus]|uniref:Helix-turn-helix domain-containing protein n=1 Tax=Streptomyces milbemycinicus TaxID=476552 RepID=A0ABW8LFA6_9ACTN